MEIASKNIMLRDQDSHLSFECFSKKFKNYIHEHRALSLLVNSNSILIYEYNMFSGSTVLIKYNNCDICVFNIWNIFYERAIWQTFDEFMDDMLFVIYDEIIKRNRCGKLTTKGGCLL